MPNRDPGWTEWIQHIHQNTMILTMKVTFLTRFIPTSSNSFWSMCRKKHEKNIDINYFTSSDPHSDKLLCHGFSHLVRKYTWHMFSDILAFYLALAVEVRQFPRIFGARGWGRGGQEGEGESNSDTVESRDPQLSGGEKISRNIKKLRTLRNPIVQQLQSKHHTRHRCFSSRQLLRSGAELWSPGPPPETAALDPQCGGSSDRLMLLNRNFKR